MRIDWTPVVNWLSQHGGRLVLIFLVGLIAYWLLRRIIPRLIKPAVARGMKEESAEEIAQRANTLSRVVIKSGGLVILIAVAFSILAEAGVNISAALAALGIVGLAVAFGGQYLIRDVIAGVFILLENQYGVGDVIKIADVAGVVEDINLRRTILRDLDGIVHSVPNGEVKVASNFTKEWSRVNMNVSVAYKENIDQVIEVINRVGKELAEESNWSPVILKAPQVLRVDDLGESGVVIKILGDTQPIKQWDVMGELRRRLKNVFDKEGIEIPFPHTKIYFGNFPPEWLTKEPSALRPKSEGTPEQQRKSSDKQEQPPTEG